MLARPRFFQQETGYRVGQRVWLATRDFNIPGVPCQLAPHFMGPFPVSEVINPVAGRLKLPGPLRYTSPSTSATLNLSRTVYWFLPLNPFPDSSKAAQSTTLRNSWRFGRARQYLVDWEGYGPEERSWTSTSNIMDPQLIRDFHNSHP